MMATVAELVQIKGGRMWHVRRSDNAPETEDMPDWIILIPGRVLVVEAKSQGRAVTLGQQQVKDLMASVREQTCAIVRPEPREGEMGFDELLGIIADTIC